MANITNIEHFMIQTNHKFILFLHLRTLISHIDEFTLKYLCNSGWETMNNDIVSFKVDNVSLDFHDKKNCSFHQRFDC